MLGWELVATSPLWNLYPLHGRPHHSHPGPSLITAALTLHLRLDRDRLSVQTLE